MPPLTWPPDALERVRAFETRYNSPDAGALLSWAVWAVDSLYYLDDIDGDYDTSHVTVGGHPPDVVDVAHARWATAAAMTAIDLCAAGLGRVFCHHKGRKELALVDFDQTVGRPKKGCEERRAQLPSLARKWVDAVVIDHQYTTIRDARNRLTHSRIPRHLILVAGGPPQRLRLELPPNQKVSVRVLVQGARECGTIWVQRLIDILPNL